MLRHTAVYGSSLIMRVFHIAFPIESNPVEQHNPIPMTIVQHPCDGIAMLLFKDNDHISCHQPFTAHHRSRTTQFIAQFLRHIHHGSITGILSPVQCT